MTRAGGGPGAYSLGIDLGTTYTAAAIWQDGRARMADLGDRGPAVPSVIFLTRDGEWLFGEAAAGRATLEPDRVAREFKRRAGDPTPLVMGASSFTATGLMASLLRWVVDEVARAQGTPPAGIAVSHPANWGGFKIDLLRRSIADVGLPAVRFVAEPEAAAIHYATLERIEPGAIAAVYDLGGGTFDAAVLRRAPAGWHILGQPQGLESLGGIDFDEAVFQHVLGGPVGEAVAQLDPDEPTTLAALARLRQDCVTAKEALAADTEVTIPVLLPSYQSEVRLTRAEFEDMVGPVLTDTLTALRAALRSADVQPRDLSRVLLVGGSSRIPLVAQVVGAAADRPVAVDAHPKHAVALGAARVAAAAALVAVPSPPSPPPPPPPPPSPPAARPVRPGRPAPGDRWVRARRLVALVAVSGLAVGGTAAALARRPGATDLSADPPPSTAPPAPGGSPPPTSFPVTGIPDVIGLEVEQAREVLEAMSITVEVIIEPTSEADEDGRVLNQYIPGGTQVPAGAVVTLTVGELDGLQQLGPLSEQSPALAALAARAVPRQ